MLFKMLLQDQKESNFFPCSFEFQMYLAICITVNCNLKTTVISLHLFLISIPVKFNIFVLFFNIHIFFYTNINAIAKKNFNHGSLVGGILLLWSNDCGIKAFCRQNLHPHAHNKYMLFVVHKVDPNLADLLQKVFRTYENLRSGG